MKNNKRLKGKDGIEERMFDYLDRLRDSGVTNMFGAAPYVEREFGIDRKAARDVLARWMESFQGVKS